MSCPTSKIMCNKLIISQAINFADNVVSINIPAGTYNNNEKYCLLIAQEIPTTATISSNVVITIGTNPTTYPLVNCDCTNVNICQLRSKMRYSTKVFTNIQSGVFKLMGKTGCICQANTAASLPITTTENA